MKKRKLNWVAIGNLIGLILGGGILLKYAYILSIKPFITHELTQLTIYGCIVALLALYTVIECLEYFEERI